LAFFREHLSRVLYLTCLTYKDQSVYQSKIVPEVCVSAIRTYFNDPNKDLLHFRACHFSRFLVIWIQGERHLQIANIIIFRIPYSCSHTDALWQLETRCLYPVYNKIAILRSCCNVASYPFSFNFSRIRHFVVPKNWNYPTFRHSGTTILSPWSSVLFGRNILRFLCTLHRF